MTDSDKFINAFQKWIAVVMHNSMLNLTRYARENGFSISQIMSLNFIHRKGTCGVSDLGEKIGVTNAAASQLLERLVQQELITRTEDPNDRRGKLITLTKRGQRIIDESLSARIQWLHELENNLSPSELELTITTLNTLIDKAKFIDQPAEPENSASPQH